MAENWQLKVCVVFQEAMLDDQEAMFDDKEAMFDDQEAMCVPMHFKVTATARFGCDNRIFYPVVDQSPPELILPDLYCRPG